MSKKDLGVLIYHEWLTAMESLSAKDVKALILAMRDYQTLDVPPPTFKGSANVLASVIFPSIARRKKLSDYGKKGMEIRLSAASIRKDGGEGSEARKEVQKPRDEVGEVDFYPASHPASLPDEEACGNSIEEQSIPENIEAEQSQEKQKEAVDSQVYSEQSQFAESLKIIEDSLTEREKRDLYPERYRPRGGARAETKEGLKWAFGKYQNVFLTPEEYEDIRCRIRDADDYIDMFSCKLYTKGYRYPDHAKTIIEWWERDCGMEERRHEDEAREDDGDNPYKTDYDAFFEKAVKRSLGIA